MKTKLVLVLLIVIAGIPASAQQRDKPVRGGDKTAPPIPYDARVLQEDYSIRAPRYDKGASLITWDLVVKKTGKAKSFEAFVTDADGVAQAVVPLKLVPIRAEYEEGDEVQAVLKLPRPREGLEPGKLILRKVR